MTSGIRKGLTCALTKSSSFLTFWSKTRPIVLITSCLMFVSLWSNSLGLVSDWRRFVIARISWKRSANSVGAASSPDFPTVAGDPGPLVNLFMYYSSLRSPETAENSNPDRSLMTKYPILKRLKS